MNLDPDRPNARLETKFKRTMLFAGTCVRLFITYKLYFATATDLRAVI